MKSYYLSKQTVFSGLGRITGYYHLLIDFIIPIYVDSQGEDVTVHVENRCLDATFDRPPRPGVMPNDRVLYIIDCVFGDRINFKKNRENKSCGSIWLNVDQRKNHPLQKILQDQKCWWLVNFDKNPEHRGIWGEYDSAHYSQFRQDMWSRFNITEPKEKFVTIIKRGADVNPRKGKLPNDVVDRIQNRFKTDIPVRVVDFSKLTFAETIQTCRESKVLIGQHGAGFANSVFMEPGSQIIEYGPYKTPCYCILADSCDLLYNRTSLRDEIINIFDEQ